MASLTLQLTQICAGGNHLHFEVIGAKTRSIDITLSDVSDPITDDELEAWAKVTARLVKIGKTAAQARTALQSGVTVTV